MNFVRVLARDTSGFSLLEVVVSLALAAVVTAATAALVSPSADAFVAAPEQADMQQRFRGAAETLQKDLSMAGAGPYLGNETGSLAQSFATVIPRKIGLAGGDPVMSARADGLTVTYVPATYTQTVATAPVSTSTGLSVSPVPNCPSGSAMCGLQTGSTIAIYDQTGQFDIFTVTSIASGIAQIRAHAPSTASVYLPGARVVEVVSKTYYFDQSSSQLRVYDGYQTDAPVVDNVVSLAFEYFGDPNPPATPRPSAGTANCLYDQSGQRLASPVLGDSVTIVPLPLQMLSDGPWCGSGATMFDADLLRVRGVRVVARIQATLAGFRSASALFVKPGFSQKSGRSLPDFAMSFTVWPPNLSGRA